MALDDRTLKRMAALQAAATYVAGLSGTTEDVSVTADIFLQYIERPEATPQQALANRAYFCADTESLKKIWREASDAGLMQTEITLGEMTGPLGDYLMHKGNLLKASEANGFVDHPSSEGARGDLNL